MDKITRLTKEIESLKKQKQEAKEFIKQAEERCRQNYQDIVNAYQDFFDSKRNTEFVLYDRFPSVDALEICLSGHKKFPLYDVGRLNSQELAEIIKHIYQFKTGKEYNILTMGVTEQKCETEYYDKFLSTVPHLYFMVGNDKTFAPYQELNGKFINEDRVFTDIYFSARCKDLIKIELDRWAWYVKGLPLNIECLTGSSTDEADAVNYYDTDDERYKCVKFCLDKNVFSSNIRGNLEYYANKVKGIKDVFNFYINHMDSYIAKILISIIIYKRNNNISELTEEDYNHIFGVLFGEKVNIAASVEQDFPRRLVYVPNKEHGK